MNRASESGRAVVGLALVTVGIVGLLTFLLVSNRTGTRDLTKRLDEMKKTCADLTVRQDELVEESSRARLELAETKEALEKSTAQATLLSKELGARKADLERVSAERDEHLSVRLALRRQLDDALSLIATLRLAAPKGPGPD